MRCSRPRVRARPPPNIIRMHASDRKRMIYIGSGVAIMRGPQRRQGSSPRGQFGPGSCVGSRKRRGPRLERHMRFSLRRHRVRPPEVLRHNPTVRPGDGAVATPPVRRAPNRGTQLHRSRRAVGFRRRDSPMFVIWEHSRRLFTPPRDRCRLFRAVGERGPSRQKADARTRRYPSAWATAWSALAPAGLTQTAKHHATSRCHNERDECTSSRRSPSFVRP